MIPKHIHYVWVGGPLPAEQQAFVESWRANNPGYAFTLWNESNIDFSIKAIREAYTQRKWAKVADMARLHAVLKHGGIYLDTDFQLYRPLDSLLSHQCFFGFQTKEPSADWVAKRPLGPDTGHLLSAQAFAAILNIRPLPGALERPTTFGPKLVTKLLVQHGLRAYSPGGTMVQDVYLCPTEIFYPYAFGEDFHDSCITQETLAVHHWSKSWESNVPRWVRLAKAARARLVKMQSRRPSLWAEGLHKPG